MRQNGVYKDISKFEFENLNEQKTFAMTVYEPVESGKNILRLATKGFFP